MTKLDPAGEPSMDEILASIRRIIAEEPPGSRAQPELPAAPRKDAAPQPQASAGVAREADVPAPRAEPSFGSSVFGPSVFAQAPARPSESAPRLSPTGKREVESIPLGGAQPEIGSQLADVLGAVRNAMSESGHNEPALPPPQAAPETASSPATNVQAAIDSLLSPKAEPRETQAAAFPARPGFTVSRDGFIPPAAKPAQEPAADPFEFSLGPSPFARQTEVAAAPQPAAPVPAADRAGETFGSFIPSRDMLTIDRSAVSEPVMPPQPSPAPAPQAAPASFTTSPAPVSRPQPDFSAMSFTPAPAAAKPAAEPRLPASETRDLSPAPLASSPAAPAVAPAPAPTAFVPAAAAPQPASFVDAPRPASDARLAMRTSPSFGEIATPHADTPAWAPASEPKPTAPVFAAPANAAAAAPAPLAAAPAIAPPPAFTATMFEAPASAASAPAGQVAPAPAAAMAAPAAPAAAPFAPAVPPAQTDAPRGAAAAPVAPPAPVAPQPDPAAALLEQLARSPAVAPPQPTLPAAAQTVPAAQVMPAAAAVAPALDEPIVEHVEPTIEPAATLVAAPVEQEADFEEAREPETAPEPVIEAATTAPQQPAATAPAAATQALVARGPEVTPQTAPSAVAPVADTASSVRTMEDTVADLLRPMLRNWLSENMPRIVERALRKELEESNRSEHKSAAE